MKAQSIRLLALVLFFVWPWSAYGLGVTGGDIPLPAKAVNGVPQVSWDGTYAELLAADALAVCWTTQQDRYFGLNTGSPDGLIYTLLPKMAQASCKATCSTNPVIDGTSTCPIVDRWLDSRKDPTCNIDAASGTPRALAFKLRATTETAPYALPSAATLGLTGTGAPQARHGARNEIGIAELSLCWAQQLREKLDTVQVAFTSSSDLQQLLEITNGRALAAVNAYAAVSKALATTTTAPTAINDAAYTLAPLALWGRGTFNSAAQWSAIGNDFAAAIDALIQTTSSLLELKVRDPATQVSFGDANNNTPYTTVDLTGPRTEALDLLYGLSTTPYVNVYGPGVTAVLSDMSAPEVGVLLGIARRFNLVRLNVATTVDGATFLIDASANNIYLNSEAQLRNQECIRKNISPCPTPTWPVTDDWLLRSRFGIEYGHAVTLVTALADAAFGLPFTQYRRSTAPNWLYPGPANLVFSQPFAQRPFHLIGRHTFSPASGTTAPAGPSDPGIGQVNIDQNFMVQPLSAHDRQALRLQRQLPVLNVDPRGDTLSQIGPYNSRSSRNVGTVPALAVAREALLQLSALSSATGPKNIYTSNVEAIDLIERAIGTRQVILRQVLQSATNTAACTSCVTLTPSYDTTTTAYNVRLDMVTKSGDLATQATFSPAMPQAITAVLDTTNYRSPSGTLGSSIPSLTYSTLSSTTRQGYVFRAATGSWLGNAATPGVTVILKEGTTYEHVFSGVLGLQAYSAGNQLGTPATAVSFGGDFNQIIDRVWGFNEGRWSAPAYDAFGLPQDWAPALDAALQGEERGVSVQHHFLERAASAAAQSTVAIQQAFDNLEAEANDDLVLTNADLRGQGLTNLEYQAICGPKDPCAPSYAVRVVPVPFCTGLPDTLTFCNGLRSELTGHVLGTSTTTVGLPIDAAVNTELSANSPAPTFSAYQGGQLQGLLLNEWTTWNALNATLTSALANGTTATSDVNAAQAEKASADAEYASVKADVAAAFAQLVAQGVMLDSQRTAYNSTQAQYEAQRNSAALAADRECNETAYNDAVTAAWSYSGSKLKVYSRGSSVGDWSVRVNSRDSRTWSPGPIYAQMDRCEQAQDAYDLAEKTLTLQKDSMQAQVAAVEAQMTALGPQYAALPARKAASVARGQLATQRWAAALMQRSATVASSLQMAQSAFAQLLGSMAAIEQAYGQADVAAGRIALDTKLSSYDVRTRFGLRKRFHSYDLWRARALTENARRLIVAARRAIEARYVVNLSLLRAPEPFVDAPSLWADQVFAADLKPPVALGLTKSATTASGLYTNQLVDYVENLKLFLDGFAIQRPTAEARTDAEIMQLPGPALLSTSSPYQSTINYAEPSSIGWSFYCPNSNTWKANPTAAAFSTSGLTSGLATMCGGSPPSLAKLAFNVDPWGRVGGTRVDPPSVARYNIRFGSLAVNLVGTGIHDCGKATDRSACYAEPFLRYSLRQAGPVWVTGYDQGWRELDIPPGLVDDGKALAVEEWLDPVTNGFNRPDVANVSRVEFTGRPLGGAYELILELTPDVRVERIERIQVLMQTEYWVRQR